MAAFTADRSGQELIEGHRETEDGRGHEEIYVVLVDALRAARPDSAGTTIAEALLAAGREDRVAASEALADVLAR